MAAALISLWGLWRLRSDRLLAYRWLRAAVLVTLLLTEVAVFRFEPWIGTAGLAVCLVALGVIGAERWRIQRVAGEVVAAGEGTTAGASTGEPAVAPEAGPEAETRGGLR